MKGWKASVWKSPANWLSGEGATTAQHYNPCQRPCWVRVCSTCHMNNHAHKSTPESCRPSNTPVWQVWQMSITTLWLCKLWPPVTVSRIPIPQTGYGCVVWCFVKKWGACIHALSGQSFVFVWLWLSGVRTNIQDNSFAYHVAMILQKPMGLNIWPLISLTSNLSFQGSGLITVTGAKLVHEVL